jgi:hypothetical protein
MAQLLYRILMWPVISLVITGGVHFTIEAIWPDLRNFFIPPVLAPLLLAYGLWVGYQAIRAGGNYGHAILSGVILGVLPIVLDVVGFGMILDRGVQTGWLAGLFSAAVIVFGTLIGAGFVLSREASAK